MWHEGADIEEEEEGAKSEDDQQYIEDMLTSITWSQSWRCPQLNHAVHMQERRPRTLLLFLRHAHLHAGARRELIVLIKTHVRAILFNFDFLFASAIKLRHWNSFQPQTTAYANRAKTSLLTSMFLTDLIFWRIQNMHLKQLYGESRLFRAPH